MRLYIVYEIFFHRPANVQRTLLQNVRVVTIMDRTLSALQLERLKQLVADVFINPWIAENESRGRIERSIKENVFDAFYVPQFWQNTAEKASPSRPRLGLWRRQEQQQAAMVRTTLPRP